MPSPNDSLSVQDFTAAAAPIVNYLKHRFPDQSLSAPAIDGKLLRRSSLYISDVVDKNGSQYVDLVQEGGGVHGIALAGYTYIMEKMGIAFMKTAATSAGSINTLLLSAVTTKSELEILKKNYTQAKVQSWEEDKLYRPDQLKEEDYYETRSEKMLEYLAALDLRNFVDGHRAWKRKILFFSQKKLNTDNVKKLYRRTKWISIAVLSIVLVATLAGLSLAFRVVPGWTIFLRSLFVVLSIILLSGIAIGAYHFVQLYILRTSLSDFGINPGDEFEKWMEKHLTTNGISNVTQLKNKMQLEQHALRPRYHVVPSSADAYVNNAPRLGEEESEKIHARIKKLREELSAIEKNILLLREGKQVSDLATEIEDAIDDLYSKIINTAKKIAPTNRDKQLLVLMLEEMLSRMNAIRNKAVDDDKEDPVNIRSPFKKEIALVSSDITNEMKAEFPAMHKMYWGTNYRISPAKYVRASMSIPGFFRPCKIHYTDSQKRVMEKEWRELLNLDLRLKDEDEYSLMMDGGLISNFPVNIFYNGDTPLPFKPTIGVKLQFEDEGTSNLIKTEGDLMKAMVSTMRYFYDRDFISKHNIFKKTVRSIDTGSIHWLNFHLSDKEKIELFFRGALTAAIFLVGAEDEICRTESVETLTRMGEKVKFRDKDFTIYPENDASFQIEDNLLLDISFNWQSYKRDRILLFGEQNMLNTRMKRKASFTLPKEDV